MHRIALLLAVVSVFACKKKVEVAVRPEPPAPSVSASASASAPIQASASASAAPITKCTLDAPLGDGSKVAGDEWTADWKVEKVGFEKPHPAIFERALESAGCSADEALIVGDDPWADIVGGKQSGLSAYWVSFGRRYPCGVIQPDRVLSSVLDLERWLV